MGLLKSVDDVPGIDFYEYRDQLYYNKYEYRARFKLVGVRYTWYIKHDIKELIDRLNQTFPSVYNITHQRDEIIKNIPKLKVFLEYRNKIKDEKNASIRIEHNTVSIFSNELKHLTEIKNLIPEIELECTQVKVSNYTGVKYFMREPAHKFRVYLKSKRVESSFAVDLDDLLDKNKNLYPCESLKYWVTGSVLSGNQHSWRFRFTSANHFIDYDDESTISYLALLHGDMLGKRYKLEKRPEDI